MEKTLLYNGTIITMEASNPAATALLIEGNKVVRAVNDPGEYIRNNGITKIDIHGRTILPGFNDNHTHLNLVGECLTSPNFTGMNEREIADTLQAYYPNPAKNEVVYGFSWDYPACPHPNRKILDKIFPDNPVILAQYGGHCMWVNSVVLNKMKQTGKNGAKEKERFAYDDGGKLTGIVKDVEDDPFITNWYIGKLLNKKLLKKQYTAGLQQCAQYGITSIQDNTWSFAGIHVLRNLLKDKKLTARVSCWEFGPVPIFRFLFNLQQCDGDFLSRGPVKFFNDGTFSAKTAWLSESYVEEPDNYGFGRNSGELLKILDKEIKRKNQAAFHTIGDRAVHEYLDAAERLYEKYPFFPELRLRLEHAQLIDPGDLPRLKKLGILVAAQPSALSNPEKDIRILGRERALRAYPFRTLLDNGIHLSFGSDAPSENILNPFECIHLAVNRTGPEKITQAEALHCYTAGSAYAEHKETDKGILAPGMLADFIIVSDNPLKIDSDKLKDIKVLNTYVDGKEVFRSEEDGR